MSWTITEFSFSVCEICKKSIRLEFKLGSFWLVLSEWLLRDLQCSCKYMYSSTRLSLTGFLFCLCLYAGNGVSAKEMLRDIRAFKQSPKGLRGLHFCNTTSISWWDGHKSFQARWGDSFHLESHDLGSRWTNYPLLKLLVLFLNVNLLNFLLLTIYNLCVRYLINRKVQMSLK